ncbi:hypothetical protein H6F77_11660 [Microcoleus sp. FACHB-831]|uniref:hypothetical protein n=1 Tax=Microcoleus sp. FACHB-831 TaxID=2692827 RepID=UPI001686498C|nr:hypothetical protein [Microcoleus sp. FACHB-831]MBD1921748.1 hypothetical protein [Microcoleus sp. FACHB-831]
MASKESKEIDDAFDRRHIGRGLYLLIPLDQHDEAIDMAFQNAMAVEKEVNRLLDGELDFWSYLEAVEPYVISIDKYCDEVSENMENRLQIYGVS